MLAASASLKQQYLATQTGQHKCLRCSACAQVYRRAGFPAFEAELDRRGIEWQKVADWITYQTAPRAMIFRRDEGAVRDVEDMKRQMRYNDYKHDPVSTCYRDLCLEWAKGADACRPDMCPLLCSHLSGPPADKAVAGHPFSSPNRLVCSETAPCGAY